VYDKGIDSKDSQNFMDFFVAKIIAWKVRFNNETKPNFATTEINILFTSSFEQSSLILGKKP